MLDQLSLQLFALLLSAIVSAFQLGLNALLDDTQLLLLVVLGHPDLNAQRSLTTRAHRQIQKHAPGEKVEFTNHRKHKKYQKTNVNLFKTNFEWFCNTNKQKCYSALPHDFETTQKSKLKKELTCSFSLSNCFLRCSSRCSEAERRRSSRELRLSSTCFSFDTLSLSTISSWKSNPISKSQTSHQ